MVQTQEKPKGPDLQALGLKSPMEVIDILGMLKIDGEPVIQDDNIKLDPKLKAQAVLEYFQNKFNIPAKLLPQLASIVKKDMKQKLMDQRRNNGR